MRDAIPSLLFNLAILAFLIFSISFVFVPGLGMLFYSVIITNSVFNVELLKLISRFVCGILFYIAIIMVISILIIMIIRFSFENIDLILLLKNKNKLKYSEGILFAKHVGYSLICLAIALFINWYYDFIIIEIPLSFYICWLLGFISSMPVKDTIVESCSPDDLKDYIFMKSVTNTICFYLTYEFTKQIYSFFS